MTVLLAIHVFISAWLVATAEGVYTEGKPAPTEAHSLIAIDKDQTIIDVEIKQATAFFFYALERDSDASVPVNDTTPPDESGSGDESEAEDEQGRDEDRAWLSIGRQSIKFGLVFLVLSEVLMLSSFVWRHHVRSLAFLCTMPMPLLRHKSSLLTRSMAAWALTSTWTAAPRRSAARTGLATSPTAPWTARSL